MRNFPLPDYTGPSYNVQSCTSDRFQIWYPTNLYFRSSVGLSTQKLSLFSLGTASAQPLALNVTSWVLSSFGNLALELCVPGKGGTPSFFPETPLSENFKFHISIICHLGLISQNYMRQSCFVWGFQFWGAKLSVFISSFSLYIFPSIYST